MSTSAVRFVRSLSRRHVRGMSIADIALAVALAGLAFVPTLSTIGAQIGDLPKRPTDGWGVLLVLAQCLPLVLRTHRPALCLSLVGTGFACHQALAYPQTFASLGLYLALYSTAAHQHRHRRTIVATSTVAYVVLAATLYLLGSPNRLADFLAYFLTLVVIWLAGAGMRRWRSDERERRRLGARMAATAERARIARELHDVVTHHVTAIVVQADAAQFVVDSEPDRAAEGLATISTTGRRALAELRQLLDILEATGESGTIGRNPALRRVADLVAEARNSGQPIEFVETGRQRPQPTNVALAAHRVVQEALTNALKYAVRQPTTVRVHHDDAHVEVEVTTAAASAGPPVTGSGGRGLRGLRERLRMMDGELEAGTRPDGGFTVRATIPSGSPLDRQADSSADL